MRMNSSQIFLFLILLFSSAGLSAQECEVTGTLPRHSTEKECLPGVDTEIGDVEVADGVRLRTVMTRPAGSGGPLPAIFFAPWLSCDTIELRPDAGDGWSTMLRGVIQRSGRVVIRVDKRGVGESEGGPCSNLDYETELADLGAALDEMSRHSWVDPERVVIFGASMGSTWAPMLAAERDVESVIVWGGGALSWFERMLNFERQRLERTETEPAKLDEQVKRVTRPLYEVLVLGKSTAELSAVARGDWSLVTGSGDDSIYGRPLTFHQQAQDQNWPAAWGRIDAPALVLYGEYDWYESARGHELIADVVRRSGHDVRYVVIPRTDHHFMKFPSRRAAVEQQGTVNATPVVEEILGWLEQLD